MGIETGILTSLAAGASIVGTVGGIVNNNKAKREQRAAQDQQKAQNKAQEMEERRKQIREERVKRARILQSAENTGTSGSSGEMGAVGGMATQLGANIGQNLAAVNAAENISAFQQNAADAAGRAQMWSAFGQLAPTAVKVGGSIFSGDSSSGLQGPLINQQFPNQ